MCYITSFASEANVKTVETFGLMLSTKGGVTSDLIPCTTHDDVQQRLHYVFYDDADKTTTYNLRDKSTKTAAPEQSSAASTAAIWWSYITDVPTTVPGVAVHYSDLVFRLLESTVLRM